MIRALAVGSTAGLAAGMLVAGSGADEPAAAWVAFGCRFAGADPTITYKYVKMGAYGRTFRNAAREWNQRKVPGRFIRTRAATANMLVARVDSDLQWLGWVADRNWIDNSCAGPPMDGWLNNRMAIFLNRKVMNNPGTYPRLTSGQRKLVMMHELGHAYGLAHPQQIGCQYTPSVMQTANHKWDCGWRGRAPWPDDVAGVNAIY